jgi:hypothetical protein
MTDEINVVSIVGAGRTGSTIIGHTLAEVPNWVLCGELRLGFAILAANRMCGCGVPAQQCPFWRAVIEGAFGGFNIATLRRAAELSSRLTYHRHTLQHLALKGPRFARETREYADIVTRIYRSIRDLTGCEVIVDTSKKPSYYLALRQTRLKLWMVHVIRDSRAVAFSNTRNKPDPANPYGLSSLPRQGLAMTAIAWDVNNAFIDLVMCRPDTSMRLRYEDFVADPVGHIGRILNLVRSKQPPPDVRAGMLETGQHHCIAGNPMRFQRGPIHLHLDDEWRWSMEGRGRALVTALTWPMLAAYGYLGRDGGADAAMRGARSVARGLDG